MTNNEIKKIHLSKAELGLDLGDGSERAEYVNQDYILSRLGRPHRCVNIMYTYYPNDKQWPERISVACKDMEINYQWDYPYDDYPCFGVNSQPFEQMRDIRRHGQDVLLTLTIDCSLSDEQLRDVARSLKPFGRMKLRINHECAGDWFTHNQRFTHKEVAEFFVRFHNIIKEEAPNVQTIFCAGFLKDDGTEIEWQDDFIEAYKTADIWSADCYLALHFGWPYDIAEKDSGRYNHSSVDYYFNRFKNTSKRLRELTGQDKLMMTAEFSTDGDVTGAKHQAESIVRFANAFKEHGEWFGGISFYQFRDRGRLGLELEDPNNSSVGVEQPLMAEYKKLIYDPAFLPEISAVDKTNYPVTLRWGSSEDADGIEIPVTLDGNPEFFEITVEDETGLMIEVGGRWFYKAPNVKTIDLMPAFYERECKADETVAVRIFATPSNGENTPDGSPDWNYNYYAKLTHVPELRIRYEAPAQVE